MSDILCFVQEALGGSIWTLEDFREKSFWRNGVSNGEAYV
jgi:hypothetical protein